MTALVIAVDGPAAAGKGTLARRLAAHFGLPYLDTGLLYRAVGRRVLDGEGDPRDAGVAEAAALGLRGEDVQRPDLRGAAADEAASQVAAHGGVRRALVAFQRGFAAGGGAVLDGRDIGTVIFPDARVKLYVTASAEARARRRWLEVSARDPAVTLAAVAAEMAARDARDAGRDAAPMKPAADAVVLDTTALDAEAAFGAAVAVVVGKLAGG